MGWPIINSAGPDTLNDMQISPHYWLGSIAVDKPCGCRCKKHSYVTFTGWCPCGHKGKHTHCHECGGRK